MEKELNDFLRKNEVVRWQGKPTDFPLLDGENKFRILRTWILTVALTIGLLMLYCSKNEEWSMGFIALTLAVATLIMVSPILERINLRKQKYWLTDQRAIVMTKGKALYYMELSDVDDFQMVTDVATQDCLVLGSELFSEVHKQLRWRACHPKIDVMTNDDQDCAAGLVFYCISNAEAAALILEQGNIKRSA
ncbi:hypothetical protein H8790_09615 [Oscillibacter hominis]|uniref:DUF304 domain-containing protein n=1 Tax=Oscillibacter hominis TaxID=2763056 RepID=A0A7G9B2E2_9FIRM|nr:hypothetical protein [Oscillibacter hominis]QNL43723.1 hypothetical protein H8790_09615 [Oscillibacter hominis]